MSGFFEELQRRKVYRVAVAYIIAAGFIIQIGSAVFPAWELPNWTLRLVVVFLLVGFPIALILAWAYDVTPQGIQVTKSPPGAHRRRNIITLTAVGLAVSAVAGFFLFRLFDIVKPPPAGLIDREWHHGIGVMADDLVAAGYTLLAIALWQRTFG